MINPVEKISIIATKDFQGGILDILQKNGVMEIREWTDEKPENKPVGDLEYTLARIKFALDFLNENKPKEKFSVASLLPKPILYTIKVIEEKIATNEHLYIIDEVETLEKKKNELRAEIANKSDEINSLSSWGALPFRANDILDKYDLYIGSIEQTKYDDFSKELANLSKLTAIEKISEQERTLNLVIFYETPLGKQIDALTQKFDIKRAVLPANYTIENILRTHKERIAKAQKELSKITKKIHTLSRDMTSLKIAYDYLSWQKEKEYAKNKAKTSEYSFALQGWIATSDIGKLTDDLSALTSEFIIEKAIPEKDEKPPIVLNNSRLISPFESVTAIYGAPQPTDVDPTPYMAPFFILFFGLCLTDAGYGIILALLSFLLIKKGNLEPKQQKLPKVLMYGGIITFFAGALFGSWFGIDLKILPQPIQGWFSAIQIMNPINQPMPSLILSAVLGITQLISTFFFTAHIKIKKGQWKDALLDEGSWLLFFTLITLMLSANSLPIITAYKPLFINGVYATIVLLILTQGRSHKNIFLKLGSGVLSLYNIVGYISDIISYSRIFALGLVTGIIAMVINIIAMLFKNMIPFLGWPIAIVILIGGHTFNLAINALSAFIHSGRLQFVEFFSKLIEGGGNWMQPLKRESQYIQVIDEEAKIL